MILWFERKIYLLKAERKRNKERDGDVAHGPSQIEVNRIVRHTEK